MQITSKLNGWCTIFLGGLCVFVSEHVRVGGADSAEDASSHVSTVAQPVLYKFDVFQVIFDDTDQMT